MPLPDKEPAAIDNYLAVIGEAHNQLPAGIQPEEGVFVSSRVIQNAHDLGLYTLELTSARSTELSSAETQLRISEQRIEELTVESEELRRKLSEAEAKIASVSEPLSRVLQILSAFSNAQEAIPVISTGLELPGQAERQSLKKELVALLSILSVNPIDKTTPDVDSSKAETTLLTPPNVTESTLPDTPELSVPSTDSPVAKAAPGGKKPLGKSHNRSTISSPPISNSPLDSTISKTTQAVEEATHSPIKEAPPHLPESNEGSRTKREETSALINDGDEERLLERVKEKRRIHPKTAEAWLKQNKRNPEAKPTLRKFCEIMGYQQSVAEDLFDYLYENATLALEKNANRHLQGNHCSQFDSPS
jgi:hypothetical protein